MSSTRPETLLSSLFYLGGARAMAIAMNLVATSRMAHVLGADNFGINTFAVSFMSYFLIVVSLGYDQFLTREIAYNSTRMRTLVDGALSIRLILALASGLILLGVISVLGQSRASNTAILIYGLGLLGSAIGLSSVYTGLHKMRMVAIREFTASLINMSGILIFVRSPDDLVIAVSILSGTQLFTNLLIFVRYAFDFGMPRLRLPNGADLKEARLSMVYFWSLLMITVTYNFHIVLLGLLRTEADVGLFGVGWKLFVFAIVIPNLISTLFLPRLSSIAAQPEASRDASLLYMGTIIVCAVPIVVIGEALIPQILAVLFGSSFLAASPVVAVLLLNAFVVSLNIGFGTPLLAVGRQKDFFWIVAAGALAGVVLNVVLVPLLGIMGAAVGTLVDEFIILALFALYRPEVPLGACCSIVVRCLLAVAPAAFIAHMLPSWSTLLQPDLIAILVGGTVGVLTYIALLHLVGIQLRHLAMRLHRFT
ncbi:oligosaccharide flippase family protein [Lichenihabitans psoromatis]|uniref:oligosaccharide flippase family protein n=1 Tax=Lichenihabitans psoromatis TaxID=2528642 RepID=UPI0010385468|nr:oligosaccharide flippase family protein [Lichenihabitans psoromatis]